MRRIIAFIAALCLAASPAQATISPSYPYTLQNGTTADASQVMGDFNQIQNDVNSYAAHNGANSDITSITGLTTALALQYGGTPVYVGGTSGGSANAQTFVTVSPVNFALIAGNIVTGIAGFSNSSTATLAVNGLTAKAIKKGSSSGLAVLAGGEIVAGNPYLFYYDGTQFEVLNPTLPTALVTGPGSSTSGDIASFNGTGGNVIQDSGIQATAVATKASPTFTGTPAAPTAAAGTNTTQLATTAFVLANGIVKGAVLTKNPYATSSATQVAHGLSGIPNLVFAYLECLSGELGYSAGDRVIVNSGELGGFSVNINFGYNADATNLNVITGSSLPYIPNKTTGGDGAQITAAKWKLVVTPALF